MKGHQMTAKDLFAAWPSELGPRPSDEAIKLCISKEFNDEDLLKASMMLRPDGTTTDELNKALAYLSQKPN